MTFSSSVSIGSGELIGVSSKTTEIGRGENRDTIVAITAGDFRHQISELIFVSSIHIFVRRGARQMRIRIGIG